jgi:dTDP-4-dehydrorhamnose reductase
MRIALLGSNGQLGRDLQHTLQDQDVTAFRRYDFDVDDHQATRDALMQAQPALIINTTAFHRVDECESRPEAAYSINALAVLNLVRIANELDAAIAHFSTDYVFDGKAEQPYTEESAPFPLSIYGNSKLAGEYLLRTTARKYLLIRTCGLYGIAGSRGKGGNFVETMLAKARRGDAISVVSDQIATPTYTLDVAHQVAALIRTKHSGLFHMTAEGSCSWYEFAQSIFELAGLRVDLSPATSETYRLPAVRPRYSVLENARLKALGLNHMRHWKEALAAYLEAKKDG